MPLFRHTDRFEEIILALPVTDLAQSRLTAIPRLAALEATFPLGHANRAWKSYLPTLFVWPQTIAKVNPGSGQ